MQLNNYLFERICYIKFFVSKSLNYLNKNNLIFYLVAL
jgi:hypothetical protein